MTTSGWTKIAQLALKTGLKDADPIVRQGAARGVAASHDADIVEALAQVVATENDRPTQKAMLQALAQTRVRSADCEE